MMLSQQNFLIQAPFINLLLQYHSHYNITITTLLLLSKMLTVNYAIYDQVNQMLKSQHNQSLLKIGI